LYDKLRGCPEIEFPHYLKISEVLCKLALLKKQKADEKGHLKFMSVGACFEKHIHLLGNQFKRSAEQVPAF